MVQAAFCSKMGSSKEKHQFSQLQHCRFEGLFTMMGWLLAITISKLIFLTLVQVFYLRATYDMGHIHY